MKATEARLLEFLRKSPQLIIPIYQRTYSWTESECRQIWDDILRTGRNDTVSAHFVGSIVYIEKSLYQVSTQSPLLVIDGQQRLTTVSLILESLALVQQKPLPAEHSLRLKENFQFFEAEVKKLSTDLTALCQGLAYLETDNRLLAGAG
ncbi:MAG: DUF262 domain-containing protein [Pseudonocardiaceae bacterium]